MSKIAVLSKWIAASAIAVAVGLTTGQAIAQAKVDGPKVEWQFSVWGNARAFTRGIEYVAKYVEDQTGGKFVIKIAYGGTLSPEKENLDGIKIGAFESAAVCTSYHPGRNPAANGLDLPFLPLESFDVARAVYEAFYLTPAAKEEMAKWDAMLYMAGILPQYEFMGVGAPPLKIEDWKGKRVRAIGGLGEAMRLLGASPIAPPASEVYTALDRGTVDAASFPFTYAHASYKLQEISKWYTTNMSPSTSNCPYVISQKAWAKLPPQYQKLLIDAKDGAYAALKAAYKEADDKNLPDFQKRGLIAVTYSKEDLAKFREIAAKPVWDKWVAEVEAKGLPGKQLLQLILDTAKKAGAS